MRVREITSFQWANGVFCFTIGCFMLVAPHHVADNIGGALRQAHVQWLGALLLATGLLFFLIATLATPRNFAVLAHFFAAAVLCAIGIGFLNAGRAINGLQYLAMGLAAVLSVFFFLRRRRRRRGAFDLFAFAASAAAVAIAAVLLADSTARISAGVKQVSVLLLLAGLLLLWVQVIQLGYGIRPDIAWIAHLALGAALLLLTVFFLAPNGYWTGVIFFGGSSLYVGILPWLRPHINRVRSSSLRTRLALLLVLAVSLPTVMTVALISSREEYLVRQEALRNYERLAQMLAENFGDYLGLHQSALLALARHPRILGGSLEEKEAVLQASDHAFADVAFLALYDVQGELVLASQGQASAASVASSALFQDARRSGALTHQVHWAPEEPAVLDLGAPIIGEDGRFEGLLVMGLSTSQIRQTLQRQHGHYSVQARLVDANGQALLSRDRLLPGAAVAKAISALSESGAIRVTEGGRPLLAGYARVPRQDWIVVLEEDEAQALAGVYSGRNIAFGVLLVFLILTAACGAALARRVNAPLAALSNAADEFAAGNRHAPLPESHISEVADLAIAFRVMRNRVISRTEEREAAEEALRTANDALEATVARRTAELRSANTQLQRQLAERETMENGLAAKHSEAELERRRLRAMLDILPVGVFLADSQGRIIMNNLAGSEIWGGELAESSMNDYGEDFVAWWADSGERLEAEDWGVHRAIVRGETSIAEEIEIQALNGERKSILNYAVPIRGDDGSILGAVAVNVDISHLKRMVLQIQHMNESLEQRVAERTAEAEQRSQQLRSMAAELTMTEQRERRRLAQILHDHLQQLLVAAKFDLRRIRRFAEEHPRAKEAAAHAGDLLDQSLTVSRSLTIEISPPVLYDAGLGKALEWLAANFLETHDIHVTAEIEPGIEPESEELSVFLFQAARELLFNIVKHAMTDSAHIRLSSAADNMLELCVDDEGVGFDPGLLDEQNSTMHFGLFSVRERLAYLGGQLFIDSEHGNGCHVRLLAPRSLPHCRKPHPAVIPVRKLLPAQASPILTNGREATRVLLVDDHKIFRQGMAELLHDQPGVEIVGEASDGEMAVGMARKLHPDVIVMDISMPRMSGIEATRHIHREQPEMRIIGLSMYKEESIAMAMREAGAADYLPKDCPADVLIEAIRRTARD